ncbi:MAG: DUF427 domain-containing protein [Rhodospirillales bacterium]|nr:DUF427 domain-containing protein [Rhodospirillales bacterium]
MVNLADTPDYEITVEVHPNRVRVVFNGATIADSTQALVLAETRQADVFYIPRADVSMDFLRRTDHGTFCPFKGNAVYWSIAVGDETTDNAAWSYEEPYSQVSEIKDTISFYPDRVNILAD